MRNAELNAELQTELYENQIAWLSVRMIAELDAEAMAELNTNIVAELNAELMENVLRIGQ